MVNQKNSLNISSMDFTTQQMVVVPQEVLNSLVNRLDTLERIVNKEWKNPLAIKWVTRDQAAQILNKDPQTVSRKAKNLDSGITYRKESRKIEFELKSLIEYQAKLGVSREKIDQLISKL